jgi:acyl-coenzyme A synthetase/AMP-(fatty) acid ligase
MSNLFLPLANCGVNDTVAVTGDREIKLTELLGAAATLAGSLPEAPSFVPLCGDRYAFVVAFCATLIKNASNLLPPNKQPATINEISKDYPGSVCLCDADIELPATPCINISGIIKNSLPSEEMPLIDPLHTAAIAFTSGSTGKSQPHKKQWRTFVGTTHKLAQRFFDNLDARPTIVATVPSQHMYGLEMTVLMLLHGNCVMDSSHPFYPHQVVARLHAARAPRLLVTTPIHMRSIVGSGLEIPEIKKTISATAPLPTELAAEAEQQFGGTVEEIYGFTEAGSSATRRTVATPCWDLLDGMTLSQQDNKIFISGDHLPRRETLQDRLNVLSPTQFEFIGRTGDLLNVGGKRASLADLSNKILAVNGVEDAVVFMPDDDSHAVAQRPAALIVTKLTKQKICSEIAKIIDPVFVPRPIKIVAVLPRSENGKLQRAKLLELIKSDHARTQS